jgi:serine/threonine protein kinase
MALSAGTRLGPYEILAPIGKGGMGEVYRAADTRLHREVAIKVSAERFSERFEREAKAIASLNHPNICSLYDVGPNYLVMELVEGENLKGPLPLATALDYARQIADALDAAHEKSIVHRDLKPSNIRIKPDGMLKVLDFGLAKMGGTPTAQSDQSPTITMNETQAGVILGTAAYMAPEQAKGKPVDKRADIWAFGVVLYEMLTGERMFHGETTTEVLASVLKEEPKWDKVPPQVRRLLQRCLEKDPQKRLRHIGDVMALVDDAPVPGAIPAAPSARRSVLPWAIAGAAVVALASVLWILWPRASDRPLVRQDVDLGSDIALNSPVAFLTNVVISPDATRVAYIAKSSSGGPLRLFTRRLDQPKAIELPGTEGARGPFFSPDAHWLGFAASGKLNKISVDGGAVVPLADLTANFEGGSWGEDNIVFAQARSPLSRIPSGGGHATTLLEFAKGEVIQVSPQILPGGKAVLFAGNTGNEGGAADPDKASIEVVSLTNRHRKTLVRGGAFPRYAPSSRGTGHLLYTFKGALYAIPFDPDKLDTHGTAVPILDDVMSAAQVAGKFDLSGASSGSGTLVYQKGAGGGGPVMTTIQWADSAGKQEPLLAKPGVYSNARLSPEGKRVAFSVQDGASSDIQVYEWQSDRTTKLTFGGGSWINPIWSVDGQYVIFGVGTPEGRLYWTRADGSGQPQPLMQGKVQPIPVSFSPDGKTLAFTEQQIWTVALEEQGGQLKAGTPAQFSKAQFPERQAVFSPDGRWLAYSALESGTMPEIYVRPFPPPASGPGGKWIISNQGGQHPAWSRTTHDLLYRAADGQIMAVGYTVKGDVFVADKPRAWAAKVAGTDFDLAPDGKRVAVVIPVQAPEAPKPEHEIVFLQNFFDELRRRIPFRE